MMALDERTGEALEDLQTIGRLALELGMELNINAKPKAAAVVSMLLFDGTIKKIPGGYDEGELIPNSLARELKSLLQDLVLVGRSSILIKWLTSCLGIQWSLRVFLVGQWY
jgi:aarF domain-containing kinase